MSDERAPTVTPVVAVGAVVVDGGDLLMVKRGRAPARGSWTLPGGRVEGGESLVDAVRREVREETGLEVKDVEMLGVFEVTGSDHHFVILDHLATPVTRNEPVAGSDADEARWIPLAEIASLECTPRLVETLTAWGVLPGSG